MNETIDYDRYGPWDIKLSSYVEKQPVVMLIHNLDKEIIEKEYVIDLGNKDDKRFLGRVTFWATCNGRSVETLSVEDWEKMR